MKFLRFRMKLLKLLFSGNMALIVFKTLPLPNEAIRIGNMIAVWEPIEEFDKRNFPIHQKEEDMIESNNAIGESSQTKAPNSEKEVS